MAKRVKTKRMAGDHDAEVNIRLPTEMKERLNRVKKLGMMKASIADIFRGMAGPYCDFAEAHGRQPATFEELCKWYLSHMSK